MKLIIRGELTDLNTYIKAERGNRYAASNIKKDETERVAMECRLQKLHKIHDQIPELLIDWYVKDLKKDFDNITFAKKFILDGLVLAGILPNDNRKFIVSSNETVYVDKKNPRVEVELYGG